MAAFRLRRFAKKTEKNWLSGKAALVIFDCLIFKSLFGSFVMPFLRPGLAKHLAEISMWQNVFFFCKGNSVQSTKQIEVKDQRSTPHAVHWNSTYLSQFYERGKVPQTSRLESKGQTETQGADCSTSVHTKNKNKSMDLCALGLIGRVGSLPDPWPF